jgi:uncharacterized membrane protein YfcA
MTLGWLGDDDGYGTCANTVFTPKTLSVDDQMISLALPSLLCLMGSLVGVFSGLLGIGGGLLVYPLLLTVATWFPEMGLDWHSLSGLAVTQSLAASSAATVVHWHSRQSRLDLILRLGVGCLIGGYLGGYTSAWVSAPVIRWTLIAWLLLVLGLTLKRVKPKAPSAEQSEVLSCDDGRVYGAVRRQSPTVIAWQTALGLLIGYVSGVIGIGGGALLVPLMMHLYGAPMRLAAGSTMVVVFLQSILAFSGKLQVGLVPLQHAWIQAVGAVVGGVIGARLTAIVPEVWIRRIFFAVIGASLLRVIVTSS